jgi:hypothetical protein
MRWLTAFGVLVQGIPQIFFIGNGTNQIRKNNNIEKKKKRIDTTTKK